MLSQKCRGHLRFFLKSREAGQMVKKGHWYSGNLTFSLKQLILFFLFFISAYALDETQVLFKSFAKYRKINKYSTKWKNTFN